MLAAALLFVRALPASPARFLSQLIIFAVLAFRRDYRDEIRHNYRLVMGEDRAWFWVENALAVGRNIALMARIGQRSSAPIIDTPMIYTDNIPAPKLERELHTVVASFHFGLWEYLPQVFARQGYRIALAVGQQRDRALADQVSLMRRSHAVRLVGLKQAIAGLGRPGITGFMLDNSSQGVQSWVESDGVGMRMPALPFKVARRHSIGLRPAFARLERGRLRIELGRAGDEQAALDALLVQVRARPAEWVFWGKTGAIAHAEAA
jgi:lauroyl/myristoyl acyltransferase